jgi:NADPH:quinone reductase-like Zn-dependent oxidoreductase
MRAVAVDAFGEIGSIHELPAPVAGEDEILVRVTYAGVNPADWKVRDGLRGAREFPLILGSDFAGVVAAVGAGVTRFAPGDRVFGIASEHGSYAEYTVVLRPSDFAVLAKTPANLSDEYAAALPVAGLTALGALTRLDLPAGSTLFVVGGTGGVGGFGVQFARARGLHVIATARSGKEDVARQLGAEVVVAYDTADVLAAVRAAHPGGVDAVLHAANESDDITGFVDIVRPGGKVLSVVRAVHDRDHFAAREIGAENYYMRQSPTFTAAGIESLAQAAESHAIAVRLEATLPLAEGGPVLEAFKAGKRSGKVVLAVS